jgi:hypothetical protein
MSGEETRDSMKRKSASSPAATARSPSVCPDSQPFWLPLTME